MKSIAIDFDGVIHTYSKGWHDGSIYDKEVPGAFDAIQHLMKTYSVFILSTRDPYQISEWIRDNIFDRFTFSIEVIEGEEHFWNRPNVLGITNKKLPANCYIDDRALYFNGDWSHTLKMAENFKTYQEIELYHMSSYTIPKEIFESKKSGLTNFGMLIPAGKYISLDDELHKAIIWMCERMGYASDSQYTIGALSDFFERDQLGKKQKVDFTGYPVSLDEAAKSYGDINEWHSHEKPIYIESFKDGAMWQLQQFKKDKNG